MAAGPRMSWDTPTGDIRCASFIGPGVGSSTRLAGLVIPDDPRPKHPALAAHGAFIERPMGAYSPADQKRNLGQGSRREQRPYLDVAGLVSADAGDGEELPEELRPVGVHGQLLAVVVFDSA